MEKETNKDMRSVFDVERGREDMELARRQFELGAESGRRIAEELRGYNPYPYLVDVLVQDVLATSAIEGEHLDPRQVRSAVVKRFLDAEVDRAISEA